MKSYLAFTAGLLALFREVDAVPAQNHLGLSITARANPPAFFLAGDSTTAVQSSGGGGWGNGFLSFLEPPAWGENLGHNGATTVSFVEGGDWHTVLGLVADNRDEFDTYVTIQFGHNDQKPEKGISLEQFQANLENLASEVKEAGVTPVSPIVTTLRPSVVFNI